MLFFAPFPFRSRWSGLEIQKVHHMVTLFEGGNGYEQRKLATLHVICTPLPTIIPSDRTQLLWQSRISVN